jgi:hypothetical protein
MRLESAEMQITVYFSPLGVHCTRFSLLTNTVFSAMVTVAARTSEMIGLGKIISAFNAKIIVVAR